MSPLAWRILSLFIGHVDHAYKGEYVRGCIATSTLGKLLGGVKIDAVDVKYPHLRNEYEEALVELIERGLVEEMKELEHRFRLVVKEATR